MAPSASSPLPGGAKGVDFGDFFIELRGDKVVFARKADGYHYTLHTGPGSGIIDVHRTADQAAAGESSHQTLFAIERDRLMDGLHELEPLAWSFLALIRPLRLGWLAHRNIGIVRGLDPITDDDLLAVAKPSRRKRLRVDESLLEEQVYAPEYLDEVWEFPDGAFSLLKDGHKIGIGFKSTDPTGRARLHWIKLRDLRRFIRSAEEQALKAITSRAIPPSDYGLYDVLSK